MPLLSATDQRFLVTFDIIEGGSGQFKGIISEPGQGEVPSFQFNLPRRLLRIQTGLPVVAAMVIRDQSGGVYMLGEHGTSETHGTTLFRNYRLFEAPQQYDWQTRGKSIDPVTRLQTDTGLTPPIRIWGVYEPSPERFDRTTHVSFEAGRFITNRVIKRDDLVDGRKVNRVDNQLGLSLAVLG